MMKSLCNELNKEISKVARQKLVNLKVLKLKLTDMSKVLPDKLIFIDNKNYIFKK